MSQKSKLYEDVLARFGENSNELFWVLAKEGGTKEFNVLYNRLRKLWMKNTYTDPSGLNMIEDMRAIAAANFAKGWDRFDPYRGRRLTTFVLNNIKNAWLNEIAKQRKLCRRVNIGAFHLFEDYYSKDSTEVMVSEFIREDDTDFINIFIEEFLEYLKESNRAELELVFSVCVNSSLKSLSPANIAKKLGLKKSRVRKQVNELVELIKIFNVRKNYAF